MKMNKSFKKAGIFLSSLVLATTLAWNTPMVQGYETKNPEPKKYALLIGGGTNKYNDHESFYSNIELVYQSLKDKGYKDKDIDVLYFGGKTDKHPLAENNADKETITESLDDIANKITPKDKLVIFRSGHGMLDIIFENYGIISIKNPLGPDDPIPKSIGDASVMELPDGEIIADFEFKEYLKNIKAKEIIVILNQCYSGGFNDITKDLDNTVVITESTKSEQAFKWLAGDTMKYSEWPFVRLIFDAFNGEDYEGNPVDADINGDDKISLNESFDYMFENNPLVNGVRMVNKMGYVKKETPHITYGKNLKKGGVFLE
ncbi:MAG: hypothetical protein L6408_05025 [Nanoarchaeota archaeon]|nr:hypothetical protein [Nanoarchaeota archaeon]